MNVTEEEKKDLKLMEEYGENVTRDFCRLCIESLEHEISPKIYITASIKLETNSYQVENVIKALGSIFLRAAEKNLNTEQMKESLSHCNLSDETIVTITNAYSENSLLLEETCKKLAIKNLQYKDMEWRFDIITRTRALTDLAEPLITMQLKLENTGTQTIEKHHIQIEPRTLVHITEKLEEALHQARSHHIKKFKQRKL
ncbi:COMM domain-containing protein 2, partial [Armadillidium nasatum]